MIHYVLVRLASSIYEPHSTDMMEICPLPAADMSNITFPSTRQSPHVYGVNFEQWGGRDIAPLPRSLDRPTSIDQKKNSLRVCSRSVNNTPTGRAQQVHTSNTAVVAVAPGGKIRFLHQQHSHSHKIQQHVPQNEHPWITQRAD